MADHYTVACEDPIEDDEIIYRRVRPRDAHKQPDGSYRFGSQAFADRGREPSVDRARCCSSSEFTRNSPENGVCSVVATEVRAHRFDQADDKGRPTGTTFVADVHRDPLPDNHAHCLVRLHPQKASGSIFKRLLESLARCAKIVLEPPP